MSLAFTYSPQLPSAWHLAVPRFVRLCCSHPSFACKQTISFLPCHTKQINLPVSFEFYRFSFWLNYYALFAARCHQLNRPWAECRASGRVICSVPIYPKSNTIFVCWRWTSRCSFTLRPAKMRRSTKWQWPCRPQTPLPPPFWALRWVAIHKRWPNNLRNDWRNRCLWVAMCHRITRYGHCWRNVWPMKSNEVQKHFEIEWVKNKMLHFPIDAFLLPLKLLTKLVRRKSQLNDPDDIRSMN